MKIFNEQRLEGEGTRAFSLLEQNAEMKVNKLESVPFEITNKTILTLLDNSEFDIIREKVGYSLSMRGKTAVAILPHQTGYILQQMEVSNYSKVGKFITEISLNSGTEYTDDDGKSRILFTKYYFDDDGIPTLTRYFVNDIQEEVEVGEEFKFTDMTLLPVEMFINNHKVKSDKEAADIQKPLNDLNYFDGQLREEFEMSRAKNAYNTNFTDADPNEADRDMRSGRKKAVVENSFDSKYGNGQTIIPANSGALLIEAMISIVETDIKTKLGMPVDTVNSGSNQHNLEMLMSNEFGLENLLKSQKLRERQWQSLFNLITILLKTEPVKVKLELSALEKAKMDMLEATVESEKAKAKNQNSQTEGDKGVKEKGGEDE